MTPGGVIGGPRQYEGPTLGSIGIWKCPSCGAENQGELADGCTACGAGSAKASHVGVPPKGKPPATPKDAWIATDTKLAFGAWLMERKPGPSDGLAELLMEAWAEGIKWYQRTLRGDMTEPTQPPAEPLVGILVPRPLLRKVIELLESTTDLPDEQQSVDLQALIAELKELAE